ncbi:MAG: hypothetical protein ACO3JL_04150 [Myxococcota bacterium]
MSAAVIPLLLVSFVVTANGVEPVVVTEAPTRAQAEWEGLESDVREFLSGSFLDPPGEYWLPRSGARTELSLFAGAEGSLGELGTLNRIPSTGGATLTGFLRLYPVDRLALTLGAKSYLGPTSPAAGSAAQTVLTPLAGARWVLVRERRFSLQADVASGPAFFAFADVTNEGGGAVAIGAEAQGAASLRYSLGPWTAELRGVTGGRIGEARQIGRPSFEVGPFSALYAGVELGLTFSFLAASHRAPPTLGSTEAPDGL